MKAYHIKQAMANVQDDEEVEIAITIESADPNDPRAYRCDACNIVRFKIMGVFGDPVTILKQEVENAQ